MNAGTVSLSGTGAITEQNGTIGATLLTIPMAGTVTLGGNNAITDLGAASSTNGFSLTNAQDLTVLGTVTAGNAATLALNVTGDLTIGQTGTAGALNAGTVSLSGTGAITEQNGTIGATLLTIPMAGTVTLGGSNAITDLGAASSTNGFSLTDARDLTLLGTVTAGNAATLALNVTGDLTIGQSRHSGRAECRHRLADRERRDQRAERHDQRHHLAGAQRRRGDAGRREHDRATRHRSAARAM